MTGSSGPCPPACAPNGPRGSGFSTSAVNISGMSSVVGLLYSSIDGNLCTSALDSRGGRIAHDIGRSLNPTLVRGQVEGSVYMALGEALMEEQTFRRAPCRR